MTRRLLLAAAVSLTLAAPATAGAVAEAVRGDMPMLMALYRDLHANPELSMQEVRTPAKLAAEARKLGFTVTEKVGKSGVVAVMKNGPGPTLMIRADMDGLPIVEQTGLPFASKIRAVARSWKASSADATAAIEGRGWWYCPRRKLTNQRPGTDQQCPTSRGDRLAAPACANDAQEHLIRQGEHQELNCRRINLAFTL